MVGERGSAAGTYIVRVAATACESKVRGVETVMIEITESWLHANCSAGSAWTRAQLAVLGINWPPTYGWKRRLIGLEISDETAAAFVRAAQQYTKRTLKAKRKAEMQARDRR